MQDMTEDAAFDPSVQALATALGEDVGRKNGGKAGARR
jgi:hypothetical protein